MRGPLAIPQNQLLQLASLPNYALHPSLTEVRSLIDSGVGALVANVGTLVQPTTRATMSAVQNLPSNLFSHSDQQLQWQNAAQTAVTPTGWAGRMSDLLGSNFNSSASDLDQIYYYTYPSTLSGTTLYSYKPTLDKSQLILSNDPNQTMTGSSSGLGKKIATRFG